MFRMLQFTVFGFLSLLLLSACVQERHLPTYDRRCLQDRHCPEGRFCRDGICAATPSRPIPEPIDAGPMLPDIDPEVLGDQDVELPFPLSPDDPIELRDVF